jgi:hypothetical protein
LADDELADAPIPEDRLAGTAALLGQLVRHSLLHVASEPGRAHCPGQDDEESADDGDDDLSGESGASICYQMHPLVYACARERLDQLDAVLRERTQQNAQRYALSYLHRHQAHPRQLARQREFLLAMLMRAARRGQHAQVQRFVFGLTASQANVASQRERSAKLFSLAIRSSQALQDRRAESQLLNRQGLLQFYSGAISQARASWVASARLCAELAASGVRCSDLAWYPLYNLAQLTWELGELDAARQYAEASLRQAQQYCPTMVLPSLLTRAMIARTAGDLDAARADLIACRNLKTAHLEVGPLATLIAGLRPCIEAEMARVEGRYRRSVTATEQSATYFQSEGDLLSAANVLLEQAQYAETQGMGADARLFASRAMALGRKAEVEFIEMRGKALFRRLNSDCTCARPG